MKKVDAVVIGAGAGGGVTAKQLATNGLSVVLLERGKWYTADDCRKDDLRNQRTSILGNATGPEDEGNPRVLVDTQGRERTLLPSQGGYNNNAACVGGGTATYGAMAWRYMPQDFRMRTTYGALEGSTLDDWPINPRAPPAHTARARQSDARSRLHRPLGRAVAGRSTSASGCPRRAT